MTLATATAWMARGGALAAAVAALELLCVHRALADSGVFGWPTLRAELAAAPAWLRAIADRVLSYRGMLVVLIVQLAAALALPWSAHPALPWLVFVCALLTSIRFRGSYNGGSDAMLLVVMIALGLARLGSDALAEAGLAYAAAQLVLSYVVAGIAKLRDRSWRSGRALPQLVRLPQYRVPAAIASLLSRPPIARAAGWLMLAFECTFPIALVRPTVCAGFLLFGAAFHLVNAIAFGLNRFLWTWLAAYPALLYWAERAAAAHA